MLPTTVADIYHAVHSMLTETMGALGDVFAVVVVDRGSTNTLVLIGLVRGYEYVTERGAGWGVQITH